MNKTIARIAKDNQKLATKLSKSKVLFLVLKKKWFNMIASKVKTTEYRDISPYWLNRLYWLDREHSEEELWEVAEQAQKFGKDGINNIFEATLRKFDYLVFLNGYQTNAPYAVCKCDNMTIDTGKKEWGAAEGIKYFCIDVRLIFTSPNLDQKRKEELRKLFIDEFFDIDGLIEVGFFTKEMRNDYAAMEKRVVTFFNLVSLYEYGKELVNVHISNIDGTGETRTIGGIYE